MQVRDAGVWKNATPHVKDAGVWKPVQEVWAKDAGVWKKVWQNITVLGSTTVTPGRRVAPAVYAEGYTDDAIGFGTVYADTFNTVSLGGSRNPTAVGGGDVRQAHVVGTYPTASGPTSLQYAYMFIELGIAGGFWQAVRGISFAGVYIRGTMVRAQDFKTGNPLDWAEFRAAREPGETDEAYNARITLIYAEMYRRLLASPTSPFQVLYTGD